MRGRIVIDSERLDDGDFSVAVEVTGEMNTFEAIGLFDVAKLQHLQSKQMQGPTIYGAATPLDD